MWLLCGAAILAVLKVLSFFEIANVAGISEMSWWWVIGGFALSAAWFAYADGSGLTRRKAIERMEQRKQARLDKQREALRGRRQR